MKDQLIDQGYCVLKNVLNQTSLEQIRKLCGVILKGLPKQHRDRNRSQGSLVLIADYPEFASLIAHPGIVEAFNTFEFMDPRFSSGYIISKPSLVVLGPSPRRSSWLRSTAHCCHELFRITSHTL